MKTRFLFVMMSVFIMLPFVANAQQNGGQIWVRAFEDRDADGVRDPNEPLLSDGVGVTLTRDGVVVDSAVLDDAPYASQGLIGFQFLNAGEYHLHITAGNLTATTPEDVTVQVSGSGLPPVIDFGAKPLVAESDSTTSTSGIFAALPLPQDPETLRLIVAALGGVIAAGLSAFVGFLIYGLMLRPRYQSALKAAKRATTTGSIRAVVVEEVKD